jgi:hypothetical protein
METTLTGMPLSWASTIFANCFFHEPNGSPWIRFAPNGAPFFPIRIARLTEPVLRHLMDGLEFLGQGLEIAAEVVVARMAR